jgi:hypothetical protein
VRHPPYLFAPDRDSLIHDGVSEDAAKANLALTAAQAELDRLASQHSAVTAARSQHTRALTVATAQLRDIIAAVCATPY